MDNSIWVVWVALFVGAAIPLNRLLPWMSRALVELDSTLEKPRTKATRTWSPIVSIWVILLSIGKGWLAWTIAATFNMPEWAQATTIAVVIIGHSWTIFSDDHPSPFWVLIGLFLALSPLITGLFLGTFCVISMLLNLPHLAIVFAVGIAAYSAVDASLLPSLALPVLVGITVLTVAPRLSQMFDDLPPTLWGLFIQRR
ncbi:hypothetical protein EBR57_08925 [bacterium]|nr:hypothetical protein [bacterium]